MLAQVQQGDYFREQLAGVMQQKDLQAVLELQRTKVADDLAKHDARGDAMPVLASPRARRCA